MNYEQKYKAALEWMQGMYGGLHGKTKEEAEKYFPELKESKDEKVKRIIHSISNKISFHLHDIFTEEEFQCFDAWSNAWLKKQGKSKWTDEDECPKWFEKPGEKPQGKTALEAIMEEKSPTESLGISPEKYEEIVNECIYGEEKPADKAEPKFHESDWVVDNECGKVNQITSVRNQGYDFANGDYMSYESAHKELRLWDISNAKDGDVLASELCDSIILFKGIKDDNIDFYCDYDFSKIDIPGDRFAVNNGQHYGNVEDSKDFHPATKEQRDALLKAMADAGYTFDFEKKELKKIEQKLSNSAKTCKNDTLLDLLQKMPSCITVDGIDYHFVLKKTIVYMAFYEGEGEGSGKVIFWMAGEPVHLLTAMLEKLKEEGLLE